GEDVKGKAGIRFTHRDWEVRQLIYIDKIMAAGRSALKAVENGADSLVFKGNYTPTENEMNVLFDGIHLDWLPVHFDFGESSPAMVYLLLDHFMEKEYVTTGMEGSINLDPLGALALQGNFEHSESETFHLL